MVRGTACSQDQTDERSSWEAQMDRCLQGGSASSQELRQTLVTVQEEDAHPVACLAATDDGDGAIMQPTSVSLQQQKLPAQEQQACKTISTNSLVNNDTGTNQHSSSKFAEVAQPQDALQERWISHQHASTSQHVCGSIHLHAGSPSYMTPSRRQLMGKQHQHCQQQQHPHPSTVAGHPNHTPQSQQHLQSNMQASVDSNAATQHAARIQAALHEYEEFLMEIDPDVLSPPSRTVETHQQTQPGMCPSGIPSTAPAPEYKQPRQQQLLGLPANSVCADQATRNKQLPSSTSTVTAAAVTGVAAPAGQTHQGLSVMVAPKPGTTAVPVPPGPPAQVPALQHTASTHPMMLGDREDIYHIVMEVEVSNHENTLRLYNPYKVSQAQQAAAADLAVRHTSKELYMASYAITLLSAKCATSLHVYHTIDP